MAKEPKDRRVRGHEYPEPEGGPEERARAFLEERLTPLRKKSPGADTTPSTPSRRSRVDRLPEAQEDTPRGRGRTGSRPASSTETDDSPPAQPDRKRQIEEYRKRQERDVTRRPGPRRNSLETSPLAAPAAAPPANNWIPIGPSVMRKGQGAVKPPVSGRTPAIAPVTGGNRCYIGAANGGVWRTEDGGANWVSLMDAFDLNPTQAASDSLSVGALAVVPGAAASADRLYVGSGEGQGGAYFGVGPILSTDGGQNWVTEPVAPGSTALIGGAFYALAVDPANTNRVVAATRQGLYRRESDGAGGFHWARKTPAAAGSVRATSVVVARAGGITTFYAAYRFGPVYSSADGHIWTAIGTGFPNPAPSRITLAVQADNPAIVYAFLSDGRVFRLDTAGGNWREVAGLPAASDLVGIQGNYDLAIGIAPNNVNRIYLGGSTVFSGGDWSGALYRCDITVTAASVTSANTYIGASVHADIHTIVFTPGSSTQMWVGCDGGVYRTDNPAGTGNIFTSLNKGLQTLTMNFLGQHPTEDAVVFCGTQDNGGGRFTGEEAWLHSSTGDSGFFVVNWNDPYKVIDTYVRRRVRRSTTGGTRGSYASFDVPLIVDNPATPANEGEPVLFYAPLVGTPMNPGAPGEADILAFGSIRPWISPDFGTSWQSIPNNTLAGDQLDSAIGAMVFASATKLYVGTGTGSVYRYTKAGAAWTRTRLDTMGGANNLQLEGVITDIAVDLADGTGNSIYITFGGSGDYRHVWQFNGAQWSQRSGPAAGDLNALIDVQHNAIVVDPANPTHIYAGADIGIWRSTDGGTNWSVFSDGLPDAGVMDLQLHNPRRLLRASTHGRGVFERTLDTLPKPGVELYVRDTQLDQGRFATTNFLPDPTQQGSFVVHWLSVDIKLDTPDVDGNYQFPLTGTINFLDFVDTLSDDSSNVATHATETITTRVYVQVHNRGVIPANGVRVMCMLANASVGLPPLPAGYEVNVQNGTPINNANWQTIGIATLDDVRVGFPRIAAFNLTSDKLPPPAMLAGNDHHCVLALVHHANDQYTSTVTATDFNSVQERKAAHKNTKVVQFTGTLPAPPPIFVPFRIHAAGAEKIICDLDINLQGYRGQVRLYVPKLKTEGTLKNSGDGLAAKSDLAPFKRWATAQKALIEKNQKGDRPYNKTWTKQRLADIDNVLEHEVMFVAGGGKQAILKRIILSPKQHHTLFLALDRPQGGRLGETFDLQIVQRDSESKAILGGLDLHVELQPEPKTKAAKGSARPRAPSRSNRKQAPQISA